MLLLDFPFTFTFNVENGKLFLHQKLYIYGMLAKILTKYRRFIEMTTVSAENSHWYCAAIYS